MKSAIALALLGLVAFAAVARGDDQGGMHMSGEGSRNTDMSRTETSNDGRHETWESMSAGHTLDSHGGFTTNDGRYWLRDGRIFGFFLNRIFHCYGECTGFQTCPAGQWWDMDSSMCMLAPISSPEGPTGLAGRRLAEDSTGLGGGLAGLNGGSVGGLHTRADDNTRTDDNTRMERTGTEMGSDGRTETWETLSSGHTLDSKGGFRTNDGRYWLRHGSIIGYFLNNIFHCYSGCTGFQTCPASQWWDTESSMCISSGMQLAMAGRRLMAL